MTKVIEGNLTTANYLNILRAYWLASGALAEVESQYKGDFEKQAHRDFTALEKTLKAWLADWNEDVPDGEQAIIECSRIRNEIECELFYAADNAGDEDGRCKPCAAIHQANRAWEKEN